MIEIQYAITNQELENLIAGKTIGIELTKHLILIARQTPKKPLRVNDRK